MILKPITKNFKKKVRPHGDKCGCKKTKYYSPALGCPNPTDSLHIK